MSFSLNSGFSDDVPKSGRCGDRVAQRIGHVEAIGAERVSVFSKRVNVLRLERAGLGVCDCCAFDGLGCGEVRVGARALWVSVICG